MTPRGELTVKDLPVRKSNRLKDYNYSQAGCYFITICVKDRQELLGRVVGDAAFGVPSVELTATGEIVKRRIERINQTSNRRVDKFVIMPNHVHMLLALSDGTPRAASPTKAVIPQTINAFKSLTTKECGFSIWQRSFHDHIIRDEAEYQRIWQYIDENPQRWNEDCYYTD